MNLYLCPCCVVALQGLAEVLAVMGDAHLSELLPELSASATSKNPFVREGHLTLFRSVPLHGHSTVRANSLGIAVIPCAFTGQVKNTH
jgi:hypothetical protein